MIQFNCRFHQSLLLVEIAGSGFRFSLFNRNYSGRHKGTEHQRHKVKKSEENELLKRL